MKLYYYYFTFITEKNKQDRKLNRMFELPEGKKAKQFKPEIDDAIKEL